MTSKFQVGQVWSYRNRPGEEMSRLIILKIEETGAGKETRVFVHIHVDGLSIKTPGWLIPVIPHLVFCEEALEKSAINLVGSTRILPDFHYGYDLWHKNFEKNRTGFFDLPVANASNVIEGVIKMRWMPPYTAYAQRAG